MCGEGGEDPEAVELGGGAYGPAADHYRCCRRDIKHVEYLSTPVDSVRERCHSEAWEGHATWRKRGDERREAVFEAEYLKHGHHRETLEELPTRRYDCCSAGRCIACMGCDYGKCDEPRERVLAGRPTGEEGLLEVDVAEARVSREEVVWECDGGVGEGAKVVRVDVEPEILEERRGCLEEAYPAGRITRARTKIEVLDVAEVVYKHVERVERRATQAYSVRRRDGPARDWVAQRDDDG